jgi:flagellar biogenesis protein FliO
MATLANLFQDVEALTLGGAAAAIFLAFVLLVEAAHALIASAVWLLRRLGRRRGRAPKL